MCFPQINASQPEFRLIAVDLFEVQAPTFNIAAHPMNRVAQAHARGSDRWTLVIAMQVPGPPHYTCVGALARRLLLMSDLSFCWQIRCVLCAI